MSRLKNISILVIDDDADLRELMADEFRLEGAIVEMAESGKAALKLIEQKNFHVVTSDMRMPNGDGRLVASYILAKAHPKPLVFMYSGYNELEVPMAASLEIQEIFVKPFNLTQMTDSILRHLGKKSAAS